jgi:hypothetical protein
LILRLQFSSRAFIYFCVAWLIPVFSNSPVNASENSAAGIYKIEKSEIRVLVYRGGLFGGFGHNHVISTSNISGQIEIVENLADSRAELIIPVESLDVDIDAARLEEGESFEKVVPDKDKQGTRENMLGAKVLDGANFPNVTARLLSWSGQLPQIEIVSEFVVRGQPRILEFPASVIMSDGQIVMKGSFVVTHGDLGLKPYKALLGGLRVRDELEIKFRITARRVTD